MSSIIELSQLQFRLIDEFKANFKEKIGCEPVVYIPTISKYYITLDALEEMFQPFLPIVRGKQLPLSTRTRLRELVELRAIFCHYARMMKYKITTTARHLKYKDHSCVIHLNRVYNNLMETDYGFQQKALKIENHIKSMTKLVEHESQDLDFMQEIQN